MGHRPLVWQLKHFMKDKVMSQNSTIEQAANSTVLEHELIENLTQIMNWLKGFAEKSENFAIEQTPLLIQEIILFHKVFHLVFVIFGIILLFLAFFFLYKTVKSKEPFSTPFDNPTKRCFYLLTSIITVSFGLPVFLCNLIVYLKIELAPRLFLLEYFRNLI